MLWISPHDFGGLQASKGGFTHRSRLIIEEDEDVYGFYYQRTDGCFDSKQSSIRNVSALHDFGKVPYSDGIGHPAPALTLTA